MNAPIAVLGATGVFGRHLVPRLLANGHALRLLVRSPQKATAWSAQGVDVRAADLFDPLSLRQGLAGCSLVINLATALPAPGRSGDDFALNDRLRREGVPILLQACHDTAVGRVLQPSIAWVRGDGGDQWMDESSCFAPGVDGVGGRAIAAALEMEAAVRESGLDWLILQGGLFYGPGTGFDEDWMARAQAGKLRTPGNGDGFVSLVHISDMAAATAAAVARWPSRQTLIVAEDQPSRWRELFGHVAALAGGPAPQTGGPRGLPSFRLSNRRAREALGWAPHYPDSRAGLTH